jgi:predicted nucleic acid-binding protein
LEAEAVLYVIDAVRRGQDELVSSDYLLAEVADNPDPARRSDTLALLSPAAIHVALASAIEERAKALAEWQISGYDALHVAAAEAAGCDYLLTTDEKLIRRAARAGSGVRLKVLNPCSYSSK